MLDFHHPFTGRLVSETTAILKQIIMSLETLAAEVARNTTVEASAVALIQGLKAKLDAAGTDPVALKALSDQLAANDTALAAAVAANTTPAPVAEPPPAA